MLLFHKKVENTDIGTHLHTFWATEKEPRENNECVVVANRSWYSANCTEEHNVICLINQQEGKFVKAYNVTLDNSNIYH